MKRLLHIADFVGRLRAQITSPVMRAKLYGFRFSLDDGVLKRLEVGDGNWQLISA